MWWEHGYVEEGRTAMIIAEDDVISHDIVVVGYDVGVDGVRGRGWSRFGLRCSLLEVKAVGGGSL
jgi:hypothetical protein